MYIASMELRNLHSRFSDTLFYDEFHKYYNINSRKYLTSVTTELKKLFPEFKEQFFLDYKTHERLGHKVKFLGSYEYYLLDGKEYYLTNNSKSFRIAKHCLAKEWDLISYQGTSKGSKIHDLLQHGIERRFYSPNISKAVQDYLHYFKKRFEIVATEFVVGNNFLGGMVDKLACDFDSNLYLIDYKTDKELSLTSNYNLSYPYHYLDDSSFTKYSLQTSCYRLMLEEKGVNIYKTLIIHFGKKSFTPIEPIYYKSIAKEIINDNLRVSK